MKVTIAALVSFVLAFLARGSLATAAERTSYLEPKPTTGTTTNKYYDNTAYRLVDGELVPITTGTNTGGTNPAPAPPPAPPRPFDHFDPHDDGSSIINSYLLAYLSFLVYSTETNVDDFEEELRETLLPQGVVDVEAFMNSYGVEGAIVYTDDAAIVVFRGTSSVGTDVPLADYLADANAAPRRVTVGGQDVCVHDGFWTAANSVYPLVFEHTWFARLDGRKIWVTGHSLGAAVATLTAFRLHYDADITVQGLQTFGSPRTGDANMAAMFDSENEHGSALAHRTVRWVVDGDPVTTFFLFGVSPTAVVSYRHVGVTHTIYALDHGGYEVKYDTGENKTMHWDFGGLSDEHMRYLPGLTSELTVSLAEEGQIDVLEEVLAQ